MTTGRKVLCAVGVFVALLLIAAIGAPNLLRSRMAFNKTASLMLKEGGGVVYAGLPGSNLPDKKLIHDAELDLVVSDVRTATEGIRKLVESDHGDIDKLEIRDTSVGDVSATVVVRVPASTLGGALSDFKKVAVRTEREKISTRDVSREFYDNEAHMRNLRAEEQQYLAIMKQARTVKDTLDVSEKLSDVRDRIERLQGQIQLMTRDIEMSVVTIALTQESAGRAVGIRWHPLHNAKIAVGELLDGLGDWMDSVIALVIKLPLILLWILTVGLILWIVWLLGRLLWLRFLKPRLAHKTR